MANSSTLALMNFAKDAANFKIKDVGVIFRQKVPFANSVALDDVCSTVDFSNSPTTIDLPGVDWHLPLKDLPALTMTLGNVAAQTDRTVSHIQSLKYTRLT